jgi:hypothetical protein
MALTGISIALHQIHLAIHLISMISREVPSTPARSQNERGMKNENTDKINCSGDDTDRHCNALCRFREFPESRAAICGLECGAPAQY